MSIKLNPVNKHLVVQNSAVSDKLGSGLIYAAGRNDHAQFKQATIVAMAECDETKNLSVGDRILYDTIGAVEHAIEGEKFVTVKAANVIAVIFSAGSGEVSPA